MVVADSGSVRVKVQCALAAYAVELRTQPRVQRGGSTAFWHGVSRPVQSPATPRVLIYSTLAVDICMPCVVTRMLTRG